jgi:tRNA(Arg) A34 adenosine deaminase TadA
MSQKHTRNITDLVSRFDMHTRREHMHKEHVQTHTHYACIYEHGKLICDGINQNTRTCYNNNISCSIHAEIHALHKFINVYKCMHNERNPYKIRRKMKKIIMYVTKSNMSNSIPCSDCYHQLLSLTVKKIYCTTNNNIIVNIINNTDKFVIRQSDCNQQNPFIKKFQYCKTT